RFIRFLHDEVGLQELAGNGSSRIVRGPPELVLNARLPETALGHPFRASGASWSAQAPDFEIRSGCTSELC
ncbi:MAG: hypothetical protein ACRDGQ_02950, partial [Candidatus Limnocylindrales bacterium]